jgi:hypothetical protein
VRPAARWSLLVAASLATGFFLVRSGRVDRFLVRAAPPAPESPIPPEVTSAASDARPLPGPEWGRVVAGTPSRAPRRFVELLELPPFEPPSEAASVAPSPVSTARADVPKDGATKRVRIEPGVTLSEILLAHYGRQGPKLAAAVARHNGLASPDAVRAGREIELPPIALLERN